MKDTGAARCEIKLAYRGKSVITVKMEVAAVEGGMGDEIDHTPAKSLDHVGLAGPDTVPCVAVRWQTAQKVQACTETFEQGENDRFRDPAAASRRRLSPRRGHDLAAGRRPVG